MLYGDERLEKRELESNQFMSRDFSLSCLSKSLVSLQCEIDNFNPKIELHGHQSCLKLKSCG